MIAASSNGLAHGGKLAGVGTGQRQEIRDDGPDALDLAHHGVQRIGIALRVALFGEGDFRPRAQQRDRSAQLVRRVRHEAAHLIHRPLDRGRRLPHQHVTAAGDEQQRHERRGREHFDQGRVAALQLDSVGSHSGDVDAALRAREALRVQPDFTVPGLAHVDVGLAVDCGVARRRRAGRE